MEISKTHSSNNIQKNKSAETKAQILNKKGIKVERSSQEALEQIGRAQLGISFKGNQEEIPEPIPLKAKLETIESLNLKEENNVDFLLTLSDKEFLKYVKLIIRNSPDECLHEYVNKRINKTDYSVLRDFFKTRKLPKRNTRFPTFYNLGSSEKLLNTTNKKTFDEFYKRGLNPANSLVLAHFEFNSEEEMDRATELVKNGVYAYGAQIHCRSKESYDKKIREIESKKNALWEYNKDYNADSNGILSTLCLFQKLGIDSRYAPEFTLDKREFFDFVDNNGDAVIEKDYLYAYLKQGDLSYDEARKKSSQEALESFIELGKKYNIEEENLVETHRRLLEDPFAFFGINTADIFSILKNGADLSYAIIMIQHHYIEHSGYEFKTYKTDFEELIKDGMNPKVAQIVATTGVKEPEKIDLLEKLVDKKFIEEIKKKVNNPNLDKHIENIFNIRKFENPKHAKALLDCNLSYEEIVDSAVKLMKSPIKLALKRPQQYLNNIPLEHTIKINGKYPPLDKEQEEEYQKQVEKFFQKTSQYTLRAIKYLDNDTFNQLMDKRLNSFEEELKKLDNLTDKSYQLVSELLSKKTTNNKPLPAKEKIELVNIVLHLQNAKMLDDFDFFDENECLISNQELHNRLLNKIFEILGLEEEIAQIPKEKLNFDAENMYTLLSTTASGSFPEFEKNVVIYGKEHPEEIQSNIELIERLMNNEEELQHLGGTIKQCETYLTLFRNIDTLTSEEIFKLYTTIFNDQQSENRTIDVLKIALFEDFTSYIQNELNEFGQANAKTKEKFELSGINYDTWLNYDSAETININNHNFTMQLWDRNPQKDLFIGNRTSCCTGIGEVNGKSTATYLANTAFNVIQLKDEMNNTVAMSRIFIGNIDSKPSLILDNIEVNNAFLKNMDKEQQTELRNKFFDYAKTFTKSLSDKDMPIYFSTSYTKVPVEDLNKEKLKIDFIGDCTNSFYSNVKKGWINTDNFKDEEYELFTL